MSKSVIFAMACFLALLACGKEEKQDLRYQFEENGCNTGEHKADSKEQYCANLKSEALNKFCATSLRKQAFEAQGCGSW